mmetsp:Transcript_36571/g.72312  ORF Transcript_36571/g.72312 Transcript_36571/m.72312 type:complete len:364 (+) Transcript_36571:42-1133(+)
MGGACCVPGGSGESADAVASATHSDIPGEQMQEAVEVMTFTIVGARGFRNSDWAPGLGKPDSYVVVTSNGKELAETNVLGDSMEPLWKEEFAVENWEDGADLEFGLYDKDLIGSDLLGKTIVKYDRFKDGFNGDLQLEATGGKKYRAFLRVKIKPPNKVYPPGPSPEYSVTLKKGEFNSYGLDVDSQDPKTLYITSIAEKGPAAVWNQQATPENQLVRGDFIVEANGARADAKAITEHLKQAHDIVMKVRRGIDVTMVLEANGSMLDWGIEMPEPPKGDGVLVLAVNEPGLIADWNASTEDPVTKVQVGDRILRVGKNNGAQKVAKAMKEARGKFQVHLVRVAPEVFDREGQKKEGSSHWRFG